MSTSNALTHVVGTDNDDVITTGATLAECCQALLEARVPCAGAVSFARTPPRSPAA